MSTNAIADDAKTLLLNEYHGVLSTHSADMPGFPFGSVVPYCLDSEGVAIILISSIIERLEQAPIIEGEVDYKLLLENIRDHYDIAQQALQGGDFATYAKEIDKVGELLELVA